MHGGTRQRAQLGAEHVFARQREAHAAQPEEGIGLAIGRQPTHRLVATDVERSDGDGLAHRPFDEATIGAVLRLLVR